MKLPMWFTFESGCDLWIAFVCSSVHVTSYLPIAKPTKYDDPRLLDDPVVRDVASQVHKTPAQVCRTGCPQMYHYAGCIASYDHSKMNIIQ